MSAGGHLSGDIHLVVGGQYGSEAKGHVADQLHRRYDLDYAVRIGGPNAGHTVIDRDGHRFALRTIPVAAVSDHDCRLVVAAGSEIELQVLQAEIELLEQHGHPVVDRLFIDPQATIIDEVHKQQEAELVGRVGSTGKGIGAARAARMMRTARVAADLPELGRWLAPTQALLNYGHRNGQHILIEGTQGYHLGLHAGHYPQSTTNDCRGVDLLSQAGLTPHRLPHIWLVFRTYPIRVAGASGPLPKEIDWESLGEATDGYIQPERTTVTQKIRRVAEWDVDAALVAVDANGGAGYVRLNTCLMFVDYLDPALAGVTSMEAVEDSEAWDWIEEQQDELGLSFSMFGTGPDTVVFP